MPQSRSVRNPTSRVYQSPGSRGPWIARVCLGCAVLFVSLGLYVAPNWAGDFEWTRATLRGLPGVEVVMEALAPEVEQAGLTKQQLQTDVELRLRQGGIRVLTDEERSKAMGRPWLYIQVTVALVRQLGIAIYNINVELRQAVSLATGEVAPGASTWSVEALGGVALNDLPRVRESARDQVDAFINAYLSVNPRSTGSPPPAQAAPRPAPPPTRRTR